MLKQLSNDDIDLLRRKKSLVESYMIKLTFTDGLKTQTHNISKGYRDGGGSLSWGTEAYLVKSSGTIDLSSDKDKIVEQFVAWLN